MVSKDVKLVLLKAYEFSTPKFAGDNWYEDVYDYELIDMLFKSIMKLSKSARKYKDDTVSINLGDFKQSDDANRVEGHFLTARHGVRMPHIDINTQDEISTIEPHHGVEAKVYFMIDRISGLILVQEDFNKIFTRKLLHTFLYSHRKLIYPYIDKVNQLNSDRSIKVHKRSIYRLTTLPPVQFMDKLKEFKKINSAIVTLDSTTEKKDIDVSEALDIELDKHEIDNYELEIKIKNKSGYSMVKTFEKYFAKVIELQKYDSYAIEGQLESGRIQKITPDSITRDFEAHINHTPLGEPSISDLTREMEKVIRFKNPISEDKGPTPNYMPLGKDEAVETEISSYAQQINENYKKESEVINDEQKKTS
ncbi:hypothetical protein ACI2JA_15625 [Alkalihalobacillus sp. NPDC078783]